MASIYYNYNKVWPCCYLDILSCKGHTIQTHFGAGHNGMQAALTAVWFQLLQCRYPLLSLPGGGLL